MIEAKHEKIISAVLKKNHLQKGSITRFPSGQINSVYQLNNDFVLKIEGTWAVGAVTRQQEISEKLLALGAKVPKVLDSGNEEGTNYILMEKIPGRNLAYDWQKFSHKEQINFMRQFAEQLECFHSLHFEKYCLPLYERKEFENFSDAVEAHLVFSQINIEKLKPEYAQYIHSLKKFFEENKHLLNETQTAVFVHDDLQFENWLHENGQITGVIDLDWAAAAPLDYDLRSLTRFFVRPEDFVEEKLEKQWENYDFTQEVAALKKFYPKLFEQKDLLKRIRLFVISSMLFTVVDYQKGRWSENAMQDWHKKVAKFFYSDWLEKLIGRV